MNRLAAAVALALALAGSAAADTFRVLPATGGDVFTVLPGTAPSMSGPLPSADSPNAPGSIAFPDSVRSYPLVPETRTYAQLLDLWQQSGAAYGVSWEVLAAINKIESNFGRNMGPSSAGAIGWMQFMPSTWERWGLDGDGDGIANPWSPEDAIPAAARYLAASGGQADISRAIFSYNHAQWYVDEVQQLAQLFNAGGVDATFNLDKLQISLDKARAVVVQTNRKLVKALRSVRALARHERTLQRRAVATRLLSDRFALDRRAAQAGVVRTAAQARVDDLRATLAQAETDLASARDRSLASSFSPAAGSLLGGPSFDSGYVFPVGGGPSLVSVSHYHHDYPAADIAAPEGSPVYALQDAIVLRAWTYPNGNCGIGLSIRTADGQSWTYCHLSYLDPAITRGVQLTGGTQLGLVGSTGHATGPHLHLQLDPTTSYPQEQAWFQNFAGTAFRWQDGGPSDSVSAGSRVFTVVPPDGAPAKDSVVLFTR
jgi:murein DD-endopeptidase MepM/ murein hydrolase activator NlpD